MSEEKTRTLTSGRKPLAVIRTVRYVYPGTERLKKIAAIIEAVDHRCMAADGPVTPTNQEISLSEVQEIYKLARGK